MNKKLIILLIAISAIIILSGCVNNAPAKPSEQSITWLRTSDPFDNSFNTISVVHDEKSNVTCWV